MSLENDTCYNLAVKVAAMRKERLLRADPMLDDFAVRLNREPTSAEIDYAHRFIRDLEDCGMRVSRVDILG